MKKKSLILISCISAIALLAGIVAIITESSINSNISHTNKNINNTSSKTLDNKTSNNSNNAHSKNNTNNNKKTNNKDASSVNNKAGNSSNSNKFHKGTSSNKTINKLTNKKTSLTNATITGKLFTKYGSNNVLDVYSNVNGSSLSYYTFTFNLFKNKLAYHNDLNGAITTWSLNNKILAVTKNDILSYNLAVNNLINSLNTLTVSTKLKGINYDVTATYNIHYLQLKINDSNKTYYGYNATLALNETSFGSQISNPYYFWQYENNNNNWISLNQTSLTNNEYDVNHLINNEVYRVIVANNANLNDATIQIISLPYTLIPEKLSDLSYSLRINNEQTLSSSNTTKINTLTNTFSLSNIKDIAGIVNQINSTGILTYAITDLNNNACLITKSITLSLSSPSNWTNFNYNFANCITTSNTTFLMKVSLLINNVNNTKLINTSTYKFNIANPLHISTLYNESGNLEQWFCQQQLNTWVGHYNNSVWNKFVSQGYFWYQINGSPTDFDDCKVYFAKMPSDDNFGTQQFLTIQATSIEPISVLLWSATSGYIPDNNALIAKGSVFTWTLPYELSQLIFSNGNIQLPILNNSLWINDNMNSSNYGLPCLATPFGLSIGTESNPTAISGDSTFDGIQDGYSETMNGVIAGQYGWDGYTKQYDAPAEFSYKYTALNPSTAFNINHTLNISNNEIITFASTYSLNPISSLLNYSINYKYCIFNENNKVNYSYSNNLKDNDDITFDYYFNLPGLYKITITFNLNNFNNNTLMNTETYYVNYTTNSSSLT